MVVQLFSATYKKDIKEMIIWRKYKIPKGHIPIDFIEFEDEIHIKYIQKRIPKVNLKEYRAWIQKIKTGKIR